MKNKVITFGFDDCEIYDRRLCELFRKYRMKATFFLISDQLGFRCDFSRYGKDTVVERVSAEEIPQTYCGMEVASHSRNHNSPADQLEATVGESAKFLSEICGYQVTGFAYPGGAYSEEHIRRLPEIGIEYARTVDSTHSLALPEELYAWCPTCKYDDPLLPHIADEFIKSESSEPQLLYIYGHSYELTREEPGCDFDSFERILKKLAFHDNVDYLTNIQTVEWIKNVRCNH